MIAVVLNIYVESINQLSACFSRLTKNLDNPKIKAILNSDRDDLKWDREDVVDLLKSFEINYSVGKNYCAGSACDDGARWWGRMIDWFEEVGSDYCLKLDPDTMVDRPPVFPDVDYFGTVDCVNSYGNNYCQGGLIGIRKRVIPLIKEKLATGIYSNWRLYEQDIIPRLSEDKLMGHVMRSIGVTPLNWDDCFSRWKKPVGNEDLKYAIVHPRYY